jgi:acyl-CoA hydrolase
LLSPEEAVGLIKSKDRIYMHGVAAFPNILAQALAKRTDVESLEINHLHVETKGEHPFSKPEFRDRFSVANYFIGKNQRKAVQEGYSTLIPCFLSELPKLMRSGIRRPDVALLNVSPPDKHGYCSLGVEVCTAYAAAETAKLVIAQINPKMPRTHGQSFVHMNSFDVIVDGDEELPALLVGKPGDVEQRIGHHLAALIPDGATLQMGIGGIPNAVLECLTNHKNLGIHTEMFSDGVLPLLESGVITNWEKVFNQGSTVTSFIMGSKKLYDFVDDNPSVVFKDVSTVNDPHIIGQNPKVCAINSAVEVDLTGQVCADSVGTRMISGVGGQVDFERGAAISKGGLPFICLPSKTKDGAARIVSLLKPGAGITTTRNHVHYVVTEHGVAYLFGKTLLERARALIDIADPSHREQLHKEAFQRFKVLV